MKDLPREAVFRIDCSVSHEDLDGTRQVVSTPNVVAAPERNPDLWNTTRPLRRPVRSGIEIPVDPDALLYLGK